MSSSLHFPTKILLFYDHINGVPKFFFNGKGGKESRALSCCKKIPSCAIVRKTVRIFQLVKFRIMPFHFEYPVAGRSSKWI